jgi:hypothetical protein
MTLRSQGIAKIADYLLVALGLFSILRLAILLWNNFAPGPYDDYWWTINAFQKYQQFPPLAWFWERIADHRHVIPKLLFFADWHWGDASGYALVWLSFGLLLVQVVLIFRTVHHFGISLTQSAAITGAAAVFLFSPFQRDNLFLPYQVCFYLAQWSAVSACAALCCNADAERFNRGTGIAVAMGVFSGLSMANGLFLWAPLTVGAILLRYPRRHIGIIFGSGCLFVVIYFYRFFEKGPAGSSFQIERWRDYHIFFTSMLNRIVETASHSVGVVLTLSSVALVAALSIAAVVLRRRKPELLWPAITLWFIGGTIAMTVIGRSHSGFVGRYYTPAIAWWTFVVVALLVVLPAKVRSVAQYVLAAGLVILQIHDQPQIDQIVNTQRNMNIATAALSVGVDDQAAVFHLGAFGFIVPENLAFLVKSRKVWTSTEPFSRLGQPVENLPRCLNQTIAIEGIGKISASHAPGFQVRGRFGGKLFDSAQQSVALVIDHQIVGVGVAETRLGDHSNENQQAWIGYLPHSAEGKQVQLLSGTEQSQCLSGPIAVPVAPQNLPIATDQNSWQLHWKAGQPMVSTGVADELKEDAVHFKNLQRFGFHTIRLPKPLRDYQTLIVRLKCDKDDFAMLLHLPGGEVRGHLISGGGEWRVAKFHIGRLTRHQQFTSPLAYLSVGPIYGSQMAISHVWTSQQAIPASDLDVQFFAEK